MVDFPALAKPIGITLEDSYASSWDQLVHGYTQAPSSTLK